MRTIKERCARYQYYFIQLVTLQLFLFFLSFPVLLWWGMSISVMAIMSTPFFTPFLTIFLGISVLIFFCVICSIPYGFFLSMLDCLVMVWDFFLQKSSTGWLHGFAIPSQYVIFLFAIFNGVFLLYSLQFSVFKRLQIIGIYGLLVLGCFTLYTMLPKAERCLIYGKKNGKLMLYGNNNTYVLIDQGFFARTKSPESWVRYTFIPDCTRKFGKNKIDTVIIQKWTMQTIKMLLVLLEDCDVRHIIVPEWKNSKIGESDPFRFFIDKVAACCVTITMVREQHALCVMRDIIINCTYNQKKHCLEAWRI